MSYPSSFILHPSSFILVLLLVLLSLAGCGSAALREELARGGVGSGPAPGGTPEPAPSFPEAVVTYTRSGGIAGRQEMMLVRGDGSITLDKNGLPIKALGDPAKLKALRQMLQSEAWQNLQPTYGRQAPDAYAYTIDTGRKTVQTFDGAQNPPQLTELLKLLDELYQAASSQQQ